MRRRKLNTISRACVGLLLVGVCAFGVHAWKMTHWEPMHIIGHVYDNKGVPIKGALISFNTSSTYMPLSHNFLIQYYGTNGQGRFDLSDIPGECTVFVQARYCFDGETKVEGQSGQTITTHIVLQPNPHWNKTGTMFEDIDDIRTYRSKHH